MDVTTFPDYDQFLRACEFGLSAIYPFQSRAFPDPFGWKYKPGWAPSYSAYGRMRSLLAIEDALSLKPKRVLEVAAGGGGLSATLAASGCEVVANDLRAELLRGALAEYTTGDSVNVVEGNLFDLSPRLLGKFDLAIACEVIEHVAHPDQFLAHLRQFLTEQGRILVTTPNALHLRNKLPSYKEVGDFAQLEKDQFKPDADGHLFLITPTEMVELAQAAGLKVERISVWGTPFLSGHFWMRYLAARSLVRLSYACERLVQRLPSGPRSRLCVTMNVVLSVAENLPLGQVST